MNLKVYTSQFAQGLAFLTLTSRLVENGVPETDEHLILRASKRVLVAIVVVPFVLMILNFTGISTFFVKGLVGLYILFLVLLPAFVLSLTGETGRAISLVAIAAAAIFVLAMLIVPFEPRQFFITFFALIGAIALPKPQRLKYLLFAIAGLSVLTLFVDNIPSGLGFLEAILFPSTAAAILFWVSIILLVAFKLGTGWQFILSLMMVASVAFLFIQDRGTPRIEKDAEKKLIEQFEERLRGARTANEALLIADSVAMNGFKETHSLWNKVSEKTFDLSESIEETAALRNQLRAILEKHQNVPPIGSASGFQRFFDPEEGAGSKVREWLNAAKGYFRQERGPAPNPVPSQANIATSKNRVERPSTNITSSSRQQTSPEPSPEPKRTTTSSSIPSATVTVTSRRYPRPSNKSYIASVPARASIGKKFSIDVKRGYQYSMILTSGSARDVYVEFTDPSTTTPKKHLLSVLYNKNTPFRTDRSFRLFVAPGATVEVFEVQ